MNKKITKILIPNRGEIAVRVQRTCRELEIPVVAVYSDPDRHGLHVRYADEAYPLHGSTPGDTYLNFDKIFEIIKKSGADAVHPGYGFLSENAEFSKTCEEKGITFIGPPPHAIEVMGEKTQARDIMSSAGVPVVPGTPPLQSYEETETEAEKIGYPVLLKASAGGGGKGMRRVDRPEDLKSAYDACKREAKSAFGDDTVYLEKYVLEPHHIEFQVLADAYGNAVHLYERECSVQRRHQKIIEETPSPLMTEDLRSRMGEVAVQAAQACSYRNAGTVEFLVDAHRNFYFLEMNTRLQVEHPVTEMITGVDLVRRQIRIAEGQSLENFKVPERRGSSIECRIYAEDPWNNFLPSPGLIKGLSTPGGQGVRDDTGVYAGYHIPMEYDPMISKLVTWGEDREQALARMLRALEEYHLLGVRTNIIYLRKILKHPDFMSGNYDTHFIPDNQDELMTREESHEEGIALTAAAVLAWMKDQKTNGTISEGPPSVSPWKLSGRPGGVL